MAYLPRPNKVYNPRRKLRKRRFYLEDFNESELSFLWNKLKKERTKFRRIARYLVLLSIAAPLLVAAILYGISQLDPVLEEKDHELVLTPEVIQTNVLIVFGIIACISLIVILVFYVENILKLLRDIRQGKKVVEQAIIGRKQFVPHNQSFYLHLRLKHRPLLEVDEQFFRSWEEGDEINLEYAPRTGIDFGYF